MKKNTLRIMILGDSLKKNRSFVPYFLFFALFYFSFGKGEMFAQIPSDSSIVADSAKNVIAPVAPVLSVDTTVKVVAAPQVVEGPEKKSETEKNHSVIDLEFVKKNVEHGPDSTYFNILKITNNNGKEVKGIVRFSVPEGWKIISQEETSVTVQPGTSEYIPVRIALSRNVTGGVSYIVNATLFSERPLYPDKNQSSVSKSCHVSIPKKRNWDVIPVQRTVYFDRYSEYTPFQLYVSNKGNGNEVIKIELRIGSGLEMYGSLGNRYFTSVMLKPHSDSVVSFPMKYVMPDESVFRVRDFRSMSVNISATVDSIQKNSVATFRYLESSYKNILVEQVYPLNIEAQLHNLLSDYDPRLFFGADGYLLFKNDHSLDYYFRLNSISFTGYNDAADFFENVFWKHSRFMAHYDAGKWQVLAGDISMTGISMIGIAGRGIGGSYIINKKHKVSGSFTTGINRTLYSGSVQHETTLRKKIAFSSALSFIVNDYNKMNTFGASVKASLPFLKVHRISLLLSGTQTQHLYDNQTFVDANGNFIITTDPKAILYGLSSKLDYTLNLKKVNASLSAHYASKHFSQYFNGRMLVHGSGQYTLNKKYSIILAGNFNQQDPLIYNKGILYPQNKFTFGRYNAEFADRINSHLVIASGPVFDHTDHRILKIKSGDSIFTRFSAIAPKWLFRAHLRNGRYSSVSVYSSFGYTYVTHAEDSTLGKFPFDAKTPFFNANTGVNISQKNWGVNISYFTGPYNIAMQGDYYYFGNSNKSLRVMPYFQRYFYNRRLLVTSYNSYFYQTRSNMESIALNARLSYFFEKGWTLFVDNNMYVNSRITNEGMRTYAKAYGLNVGFRKSFDIPQPAVKYYDLKVVCFRDFNGNGIMDANEHGLSDIVVMVDRQSKKDSVTNKPLKLRGHFAPAEMVTDNFGQINYYHIPQGDFDLNVFPLLNLKDFFNIKGQKQSLSISSDTTYYIPFVQTYRVEGHVILKRDEFSSAGNISLANIRITAMDSIGNNFTALTSRDGSYTLYAPQAGTYNLTANNVFGENFILQDGEYAISFNGAKEFNFDFVFVEKKRAMNINTAPLVSPSLNPPVPVNTNTVQINTPIISPKDTTAIPGKINSGKAVIYRIQIGASATKIPPSQYATRFKGAENVKEYVENGVFKYTSGEYNTWEFEKATEYKDKLIALGYKDAFVAFFRDGKRIK